MIRPTTAPRRIGLDDPAMARLQTELTEHGHVYIDGIPAGFDHAAFLTDRLGPLLPQYDGETVWSIKAVEQFSDIYHSLNLGRLTPHTECYEWEGTPPRYLALWCVVPTAGPGGQTTLADGRSFLDSLGEPTRTRLRSQEYRFVSSAGLQQMQLGRVARHPIVEERPGREAILRFSCQCVQEPDPFFEDISRCLQEFFDSSAIEVEFAPRSLLIWDNHRMLHARNAFTDPRRHLRRVWIAET